MDCLVSIIMPVYQIEKYIRDSIESVLRQTYTNFELILVDDGSKDSSGQIIDEYAKKDTRIRVFHQKNQGVSVARNTGIEHARGKYLLFVDSDDLVDENLLLKTIPMVEDEQLDLLWFDANTFSDSGSDVYLMPEILVADKYLNDKRKKFELIIYEYLNCRMLFNVWNKVFRTEIVKNNQIHFTDGVKVGEDLAFALEYLAYAENVKGIEDKLYNYRCREASVMNQIGFSKIHLNDFHRFLLDVCDTFHKEGYDRSVIRAIFVKTLDNQMIKRKKIRDLKLSVHEVEHKWKLRLQILDALIHPKDWIHYLPYGKRYKIGRILDFMYCFLCSFVV